MVVEFPNMGINFVSKNRSLTEDEALDHARIIIFERLERLPQGYYLVKSEKRDLSPLHTIEVR